MVWLLTGIRANGGGSRGVPPDGRRR